LHNRLNMHGLIFVLLTQIRKTREAYTLRQSL
jgi:hypothetical protein